MSTPFLIDFSTSLVAALLRDELLEVTPGSERAVVAFLADWLARNGKGRSLISLAAQGLLASPDVEELYADNDRIKDVIDGLRGPS
jgi:hypothetical protein